MAGRRHTEETKKKLSEALKEIKIIWERSYQKKPEEKLT